MAEPLGEAKRAEVLDQARAGASRNEVARRTGVSTASVSRICGAAGHTFDRSRTIVATVARVVDLKAARVTLAADVLDDVAEARARMHAADDPKDFYFLSRSVAELAATHVRLVGVDGLPDGSEQGKSMLGDLMGNLRSMLTNQPTEAMEGTDLE